MIGVNVSLVICTRNRGNRLGPCLDALCKLDPVPGFEIVFVDNGSTDDTRAILNGFRCSFPVTVVEQPVPGLGRARNTGSRAARGAVIAFTDDDCYVHPDFAAQVASLFAADPQLGFFGGRVMLHDPADLPVTIKENLREERFAPYKFLIAGAVHGANFGFRRDVLEALGGFDERLGAGTRFAAEDIEMVGRALAAGYEGLYSPAPAVSHHHGRKLPSDLRSLCKSYDFGRGAYYASMMRQESMRGQTLRYWLGTFPISKRPRRLAEKMTTTLHEISGAMAYWRLVRRHPAR